MSFKHTLDLPESSATHFKRVGGFKVSYLAKKGNVYKFIYDKFYYIGSSPELLNSLSPMDILKKPVEFFDDLEPQEIYKRIMPPKSAWLTNEPESICIASGWHVELDDDGFYLVGYHKERVADELGPYPNLEQAFEDAESDPF